MPTTIDIKLISWLQKMKADLTDRPVTEVHLVHAADGSSADRLHVGEVRDETEAEDLAAELWEAANHDSATRASGMPQRYVVAAYRTDEHGGQSLAGQYPFVLEGGLDQNRLMLEDTYAPNERGVTAQGMAQTERMHQLMFAQNRYYAEAHRLDLERERKRRIELEDRALDLMKEREELLDKRMDRELRQAEAIESKRRQRQMMDMFMRFAPMLLTQFAGGKQGGANDEVVRQFLSGLSEDEVMGIVAALKPENQAVVIQLYSSYQKQDQKEQKEIHPLLRDDERLPH